MTVRRHLAALAGAALFLTGCTTLSEITDDPSATDATGSPDATEATDGDGAVAATPAAQRCLDGDVFTATVAPADPLAAWTCADAVVIIEDAASRDVAVPLAAALGGPVLLTTEAPAHLARLAPAKVVFLGAAIATIDTGEAEVVALGGTTPFTEGLAAAELLGATEAIAVLADDPEGRVGASLLAASKGVPLIVLPSPVTTAAAQDLSALEAISLVTISSDATKAREVLRRAEGAPRLSRLPVSDLTGIALGAADRSPAGAWLVAPDDLDGLLRLATLAATGRHAVLTVLPDVLATSKASPRLAALVADGTPLAVIEGVDAPEGLDRALLLLASGNLAPGGGYSLTGKRFVAMYGTPGTSSLGVLGEQDLDATVERVRQMAAPYDDGTLTIVPTFEMIVTVASASATENGDYSYGISHDLIREWVDRAAAEDIQVILDLQSGRTDFLTQAKELEEFLVQPHVGLALDPEWRLKENQVHLRQIGSVTGEEVNTVVDYLVGLTQEHDLPQKMLVLHQFNLSMIRGRDQIRTPDELLVVLHMDGQGSLGAKYGTYGTLFDAGEPTDQGMVAGWKNFFDEDIPMANPGQVLALEPQPVFISFQ